MNVSGHALIPCRAPKPVLGQHDSAQSRLVTASLHPGAPLLHPPSPFATRRYSCVSLRWPLLNLAPHPPRSEPPSPLLCHSEPLTSQAKNLGPASNRQRPANPACFSPIVTSRTAAGPPEAGKYRHRLPTTPVASTTMPKHVVTQVGIVDLRMKGEATLR